MRLGRQRLDPLATAQGLQQFAGRGALGQNQSELRPNVNISEPAGFERAQHLVELQRRR